MDDAQLKLLLSADVPAQDPYFVMGAMARAEQHRFRRELIRTMALCAAAILLLALVMPRLNLSWLGSLSPISNLAIGVALMVATILGPRLFAARD